MPRGPIVFNTAEGFDANASGLGPTVPTTGSANCDGSNVIVVDDTTGIQAGDVIWVNTSGGRRFGEIESFVTDATITCLAGQTFNSGTFSYGVGGKRATLGGSTELFADFTNGWIVELEDNQTISASIPIAATVSATPADPAIIRGAAGSRKVIEIDSDNPVFSQQVNTCLSLRFENLKFQCSVAGDPAAATAFTVSGGQNMISGLFAFVNCEIGDASNPLFRGIFGSGALDRLGRLIIQDCWIHDCVDDGVFSAGTASVLLVASGNQVTSNGGAGIYLNSSGAHAVKRNVFGNNGNVHLRVGFGQGAVLAANTFHNAGAGSNSVEFYTASAGYHQIFDNIFNGPALNHISGTDADLNDLSCYPNSNNLFFGASGSNVTLPNLTEGENAIIADPSFVDAANNNFALNVGSPARDSAYANNVGNSGESTGFGDRGAVQSQDPGGGGGGLLVHPGMTGGIRG